MLEKYADLLLDGCLNVKKNQPLLISCPIESYKIIRILVQKAYKKGIKDIYIDYSDEEIKQLQLKYLTEEELKKSPYWNKEIFDQYAKKDAAFLMLGSYEERNDIAAKKLEITAKISRLSRLLFKERQLNNAIVWCIAAVATQSWADKMFPDEKNNV